MTCHLSPDNLYERVIFNEGSDSVDKAFPMTTCLRAPSLTMFCKPPTSISIRFDTVVHALEDSVAGPAAALEVAERGCWPLLQRRPEAHFLRAEFLERLGRLDDARAAYQKVLTEVSVFGATQSAPRSFPTCGRGQYCASEGACGERGGARYHEEQSMKSLKRSRVV